MINRARTCTARRSTLRERLGAQSSSLSSFRKMQIHRSEGARLNRQLVSFRSCRPFLMHCTRLHAIRYFFCFCISTCPGRRPRSVHARSVLLDLHTLQMCPLRMSLNSSISLESGESIALAHLQSQCSRNAKIVANERKKCENVGRSVPNKHPAASKRRETRGGKRQRIDGQDRNARRRTYIENLSALSMIRF